MDSLNASPLDRAVAGSGPALLAANELPFAPIPEVIDAVSAELAGVNRYPDSGGDLERALAEQLGVGPECVTFGPGSVGLLHQVMRAYVDPGFEVVYAWRSFEAYPGLVSMYHGVDRRVPLDAALGHDLPAMLAALTANTRAVIVCNPNNPTGTVVDADALARFVAAVPGDCLIVVDEAYREFCDSDGFADGVALIGAHPNVCVLRTFSKAFGLAGLRIGYAVARPDVIGRLDAARLHFGVNRVARSAASASLRHREQVLARVAGIVSERGRVQKALRAQGWTLPDSAANFVWLPLGTDSAAFARACEVAGLLVRPLGEDGVRVTIGTAEANDRFLAAAARWRGAHEPGQPSRVPLGPPENRNTGGTHTIAREM